jgi:hypothetical protein
VRALREKGLDADPLASRWEGEGESELQEDVVPDDEVAPE